MVIQHSVIELLAKNSVTRPRKYIVGYKSIKYCEINIFIYLGHVESNLTHSLSLIPVSNF